MLLQYAMRLQEILSNFLAHITAGYMVRQASSCSHLLQAHAWSTSIPTVQNGRTAAGTCVHSSMFHSNNANS